MALNQNYTAVVQVKVSDVQLKSQLNNIKIKPLTLKVRVDSKDAQTQLNSTTNVTKDFQKQLDSTTAKVDKMGSSLRNTSKQAKSFGDDFISTLGKVAKFFVITQIIHAFTQGISEAVQSVKKLDDSLIELQKVSDEVKSNLSGFTDQAFELAEAMSTSASNVTNAVTEFSKSGYGLQDSLQLAEQAMVFQTIADDAISASDSATMLIQTMRAYNMTASDSEHIISALNEVSNNYAVSSTDLSQSIGKVASVANLAGVDFEHLLGLMTASTEVTQNASKSANGYKTILTNLMTKDLEKQFNEFGLSMRDTNGALKDGYQIIEELSSVYKKLGTTWSEDDDAMVSMNDNFNALMEDIAGKHNINVLVAGLQNFEQATNATNSALNSAGSAQEEFDTAMSGLTKKIEGLKGQFQELVWSNGGLNDFLKTLVDLGTNTLKLINDLGGLPVVLLSIASAIAIIKGQSIQIIIAKLITTIPTLITSLKGLQIMYNSATRSIILSNQAINASIPIIGALLVAITALTIGYSKLKKSQEEAEQKRQEIVSSAESEISSLDELLDKVKDETLTRQSLYDLIKSTDAYSKEIEDMKDVNEMRQAVIDKINEEKIAKAQEIIDTGQIEFERAIQRQKSSTSDFKFTPYADTRFNEPYSYISSAIGTQQQIDSLQKYKDTLVEVRAETKKGGFDWKQYTKEISRVEEELGVLQSTQKEDISTIDKYNNALGLTGQKYDDVTGQFVKMTDAEKAEYEASKNSKEQTDLQSNSTDNLTSSLDTLNNAIDTLQSDYDSLSSIVNEYNLNNGLSIDSVQKLLSLTEEYGSALSIQNGQLVLNDEELQKRANALLENAKQEVYSQTMTKLNAIAQSDVATAMQIARGEIDATTNSLEASANAYDTASVSAYAYQILNSQGQKASAVTKVLNDMKTQISLVESAVNSMGKTFVTSMTGSKSATEDATDALNDYKTVSSYITDKIKDQIDTIKDQKEAELDSIDARIKALENLRDDEEDYWDAKIDALNKQNDAIEDQIEYEKLLEALANAKSKRVKIYSGGTFTYGEDESAISEAQQNIANYKSQQEYKEQLALLESYKDSTLANYNEQITNLENYRNQVEDSYNAQIDYYENMSNEFTNMVNAYDDEQNRLLALELTGIDFEKSLQDLSLSNLQDYINKWNTLQASKNVTSETTTSSSSGMSSSSTTVKAKIGSGTYASGSSSIGSNQVAIVGEDPNREIVIGSKLNNGVAMNLSKGSGVVNAKSTNTLAGILNNLGGLGKVGETISNANKSVQNYFNITANVQNGEGLVDYLQNFSSSMTQKAFS